MPRDYSPADRLLMRLASRMAGAAPAAGHGTGPDRVRANPAGVPPSAAEAGDLPPDQKRHAAGLMRVNHAGEIAAQALYHGQALTARSERTRAQLLAAAAEEQDHLRWCEERLAELGEKPSALQPLWYAGSYAMGAVAGLAGDRWSLGFVGETEAQVVEHLETHLEKLPAEDGRSRAIVEAMRDDEARHGREAAESGGRALPGPVRWLMQRVARVMTRTAYWI